MPAYNCETTIRKAVESLQAQTAPDLEIIVVDDGSTDGTGDLVETMAGKDARIKLVRLEINLGVGNARKVAIDNVTGDWLTMLDADDWYEPNRVEVLLNACLELNADVVFDNLQIYDHVLKRVVYCTRFSKSKKALAFKKEDLFRLDNPLRPSSVGYAQPMFRTKFLREHKINYGTSYRIGEDFIFLADFVLSGARAFMIPEAYYVYVHRTSPSTNKISPFSRSATRIAEIVQASDDLRQKYAATMSAEAQRLLLRRKRIFENFIVAQNMKEAVRQGQFIKAALLILKCPFILLFVATNLYRRVRAKVRLHLMGAR